ncbi:MAG TPA: PaaI family thioesterase [Acidimicrobiia bacterium]|nr:PaaI family thioesterase [Acidimicrobiia bacterium]
MTTDSPLERNRARLEAVFLGDAYVKELGAELVEWDGGRAVYRLPVEAGHMNFVGSVHGGALFSLGDCALGVASNSWGRICVALSIEIHYLTAGVAGETLRATAVERARTRRTASFAIEVTSESDGKLRASFQAMCFRTGRWHLGEDAWPQDWRDAH